MAPSIPAATTLAGLVVVLLTAGQQVGDRLRITYLANEGVILSDGNRDVIIDGLFRYYGPEFALAPDSVRDALARAAPPYADIDLVLITHRHGDHFHPADVAAHLEANRGAIVLTSPQVVDSLRGRLSDASEVGGRIQPRAVAPFSRRRETVAGIAVELLGLPHGGGGRMAGVQHLGYIVELGGRRILHLGDAEIEPKLYQAFRLDTARIDVALVPQWMLFDRDGLRSLNEFVRPRQVVAFHFSDSDRETAQARVAQAWPGAVALVRPLQQLRF
jgi:L-ascorbate metabolism protein UlaG (beta-lactamase superfamily)